MRRLKTSKISDILNIITDLVTPSGIIITGYFTKPGNNVWFVGRVKTEDYRKLSSEVCASLSLSGNVNSKIIYIENSGIVKTSEEGGNPEYMSVHILPYEIVVGVLREKTPILVNSIEMEMAELDWFFCDAVVSLVHDVNADKFPARFNRLEINTNYENKKISILRTFRCSNSRAALTFANINRVVIEFDKLVPLMEAIHDVASIKKFFVFLPTIMWDYQVSLAFLCQRAMRLEKISTS